MVCYIITLRKDTIKVYEDGEKFEVGKVMVLLKGSDAAIVVSGIMVSEVLVATGNLKSRYLDNCDSFNHH